LNDCSDVACNSIDISGRVFFRLRAKATKRNHCWSRGADTGADEEAANAGGSVGLGLEQKGEQVSFRGEISPSEIVRFYHDVLAPGNWQPDARLGAEVGGYVFTRGAQTIAIRVTENDSKTSTLTVLVKAGEYKPAGP
jgi:hypothetical protein